MKKILEISIVPFVIVLIIVAVLIFQKKAPATSSVDTSTSKQTQSVGTKSYTMATVVQHGSDTDCWMVISGKVYDVTSYIPSHPNPLIVRGCGKEATVMFEEVRKHAGQATSMLDEYLIGSAEK